MRKQTYTAVRKFVLKPFTDKSIRFTYNLLGVSPVKINVAPALSSHTPSSLNSIPHNSSSGLSIPSYPLTIDNFVTPEENAVRSAHDISFGHRLEGGLTPCFSMQQL